MSKRLILVNVALAVIAVFFAVTLIRDLTHARPLPGPPAPRRAASPGPAEEAPDSSVAAEKLATYNVIVAKHLFNPSRTEGASAAAATPAAPPPPKPLLLGVVVDGARSRAYLEDPTTKRVFGYQVGDTVAGGRIDKITDEKVVIVRSDGQMDVMLRDPSKPKPAPPAPAAAVAPPGATTPPPGPAPVPGARVQTPPVPGRAPIPPRAIRRLPTEETQESQKQ